MEVLLPTAYAGNIEYYSLFFRAENPVLEASEQYVKQTFRNRCSIYSTNGKLDLSIPVFRKNHMLVADIKINNQDNWKNLHWKSITSAYKKSPFFEFYDVELKTVLDKDYGYLLDFNLAMHEFICQSLQIDSNFNKTSFYKKNLDSTDYRKTLSPKVKSEFKHKKYIQVFSDTNEFIPNLSILDLIFCEGPNAVSYL